MNSPRSRRTMGFSLVELLITISILVVIVGGVYGIYDSSVHNARVNTMLSQRRAIKTAIDQYFSRHGRYPPTLEALTRRYLSEIPVDPLTPFHGNDWLVRGPGAGDQWLCPLSDGTPTGGIFDVRSASGL